MKLEKAIEYLKDSRRVFLLKGETEYAEADQLGIEALKAWQFLRSHSGMSVNALLPGETPGENPLPRLATYPNEAKDKGGTK